MYETLYMYFKVYIQHFNTIQGLSDFRVLSILQVLVGEFGLTGVVCVNIG